QLDLLTAVQLPVEVPQEVLAKPDDILKCMLLDKKTVAGDLKFVLPDSIGHVDTIGGIDTKTIVDCLSS
ncbi:MAG: 3-dehydroquinate synthase, partial [Fuerstiella sp.]|nr:3-dehydroquinate synthase [Fuerstiella sp.]